jgi:hypothetical protein
MIVNWILKLNKEERKYENFKGRRKQASPTGKDGTPILYAILI